MDDWIWLVSSKQKKNSWTKGVCIYTWKRLCEIITYKQTRTSDGLPVIFPQCQPVVSPLCPFPRCSLLCVRSTKGQTQRQTDGKWIENRCTSRRLLVYINRVERVRHPLLQHDLYGPERVRHLLLRFLHSKSPNILGVLPIGLILTKYEKSSFDSLFFIELPGRRVAILSCIVTIADVAATGHYFVFVQPNFYFTIPFCAYWLPRRNSSFATLLQPDAGDSFRASGCFYHQLSKINLLDSTPLFVLVLSRTTIFFSFFQYCSRQVSSHLNNRRECKKGTEMRFLRSLQPGVGFLRTLSRVFYYQSKKELVNNPAPMESLSGIQCAFLVLTVELPKRCCVLNLLLQTTLTFVCLWIVQCCGGNDILEQPHCLKSNCRAQFEGRRGFAPRDTGL